MAGIDGHITIEKKVRPCMVGKRKALFHRWADKLDNSKRQVVAIVEWDDGTVHETYPQEIRFVDNWVDVFHDNL